MLIDGNAKNDPIEVYWHRKVLFNHNYNFLQSFTVGKVI